MGLKTYLLGGGLAALIATGCDKSYDVYVRQADDSFSLQVDCGLGFSGCKTRELFGKYLWLREQNGKEVPYKDLIGLLLKLDANGDGEVTQAELASAYECELNNYLAKVHDDCLDGKAKPARITLNQCPPATSTSSAPALDAGIKKTDQ